MTYIYIYFFFWSSRTTKGGSEHEAVGDMASVFAHALCIPLARSNPRSSGNNLRGLFKREERFESNRVIRAFERGNVVLHNGGDFFVFRDYRKDNVSHKDPSIVYRTESSFCFRPTIFIACVCVCRRRGNAWFVTRRLLLRFSRLARVRVVHERPFSKTFRLNSICGGMHVWDRHRVWVHQVRGGWTVSSAKYERPAGNPTYNETE